MGEYLHAVEPGLNQTIPKTGLAMTKKKQKSLLNVLHSAFSILHLILSDRGFH